MARGRRRGKLPADYRRRGPVRQPYDVILIVCEGGKTEPNYFRRLCAVCGLSNANVRITPADGTDPVSIVRFAEKEFDEHDRVYCVFDRNGHDNYNEALKLVANSQLGKRGVLRAITSVPCFEIWVLLHFRYTTAPFNKTGSQSACNSVLKEVKKEFAEYTKGHKEIYDKLVNGLVTALDRATLLTKHNIATGSSNPATQVHDLVDYLRKVKG